MTYPNIYAAQVGPLALATLDANFLWATDIQSQAITANAGGTADAITATYIPAVTALINGLTLYVRASASNATTTPQFSPNGLTARTIVKATGSLVVGDIAGAGHWLQLTYDTTLVAWVLSNPADTQGGNLQATSINGGQLAGLRNRIINGDMRIDQRSSYAAQINVTSPAFIADRFAFSSNQNGKWSVQDQPDTTNPGFINSAYVTPSVTYATGSTDFALIEHKIEGLNVADLAWGTASAKAVTISFWVKTSVTGSHCVSVLNSSANRCYLAAYTVAVANTWQKVTLTIPGDTTGTWLTTTGIGIWLRWGIAIGATYYGTAGSWGSTVYYAQSGDANISNTASSSFVLTGVQLEVGSVATTFEQRPYGMELALCQRYYYRISPAANTYYGIGLVGAATTGAANIQFKVSMRSAPTALEQTGTASDYKVATTTTALVACTAVPTHLGSTNTESATIGFTSGTLGGTAGQVTFFASGGVSTSYLGWSAEL